MAEGLWEKPSGSTPRGLPTRRMTSAAIRSCRRNRPTLRPGYLARIILTCECGAPASKPSRSCKYQGGSAAGPYVSVASRTRSAQPLIPRVLRFLARDLRRSRRRALAARNLHRLAAGDFVAGIIGHLPEEPRRHR